MSSPVLFAGSSTKALIGVVSKRLSVSFDEAKGHARILRVLWFMRQAGSGWILITELQNLGAATWRTLPYIMPQAIKQGVIDTTLVGGKIRYKINNTGKELLIASEQYMIDEYQRSVDKCTAYKIRHGIK